MSSFAVWTEIHRFVDKKRKSSSFTTRVPEKSPPLNGDTYRALSMHHTIFIRVSPARRISREERGISYVSPCIFPILLEQVNGKRAFPRLSFVFHEMSSSRIESLCRDTFVRCVIRSSLLLVKEPPSQSHFHVVSEGIFLRERSIADHFTQEVSESGVVALGPIGFPGTRSVLYLRYKIRNRHKIRNRSFSRFFQKHISSFALLSVTLLFWRFTIYNAESKCEHINYICCRCNFELLFPRSTAILLIYCLTSSIKYLPPTKSPLVSLKLYTNWNYLVLSFLELDIRILSTFFNAWYKKYNSFWFN